jgi:hypothetical protein
MIGRRKPRAVQPEISEELRPLDPARSLQDWLEWLRIVQPLLEPERIKQINC